MAINVVLNELNPLSTADSTSRPDAMTDAQNNQTMTTSECIELEERVGVHSRLPPASEGCREPFWCTARGAIIFLDADVIARRSDGDDLSIICCVC